MHWCVCECVCMDKLLTHRAGCSGEPWPWHVQQGEVLSLMQEASFSVESSGRPGRFRLVFLAGLVKQGCLNPFSQDASSWQLLPWAQRPGCDGHRRAAWCLPVSSGSCSAEALVCESEPAHLRMDSRGLSSGPRLFV